MEKVLKMKLFASPNLLSMPEKAAKEQSQPDKKNAVTIIELNEKVRELEARIQIFETSKFKSREHFVLSLMVSQLDQIGTDDSKFSLEDLGKLAGLTEKQVENKWLLALLDRVR